MTSNHYCMTSNHVPLISAFKMTFRMTFRMTYRMTIMMTLRMTFKMGYQGGFQGWLWRGLVRVLLPRSRSGPGQVQVNFNSDLILFYFSRAWLWSRTTCLDKNVKTTLWNTSQRCIVVTDSRQSLTISALKDLLIAADAAEVGTHQ